MRARRGIFQIIDAFAWNVPLVMMGAIGIIINIMIILDITRYKYVRHILYADGLINMSLM